VGDFVGRTLELRLLRTRLESVERSGRGAAVAVRGRRQVGKSRLAQEFCDQARVPYLFFTAIKGASPVESIAAFTESLRESTLPSNSELLPAVAPARWPDAFRLLSSVLPAGPSVIVMDEVPWLAEQDGQFDGALQVAWDRLLAAQPVLLLLLGSDIHMMERLTAYDRPFFGRADNLALGPLNPLEVRDALDLGADEAIDAHLITGGLPGVLRSWLRGMPPLTFLEQQCADPAAAVFSIPESALLAEFPAPDQSRRVLEALGGDAKTHSSIAAAAGGQDGALPSGTLSPVLRRLVEQKRVLALDDPLSTRPGRPALYRVADSNLRLYLAFGRAAHELARRGRPDAAYGVVQRRWTSWRGRAVEPLIRDALVLSAGAGGTPWPEVGAVGAWWNRQFDPEVDLVGADRSPVAGRIYYVGSVKWLGSAFDRHDLAALARGAVAMPGYVPHETGFAVVSLSGTSPAVGAAEAQLIWGPQDVLSAWRQ
jgi:uncharacterized protein